MASQSKVLYVGVTNDLLRRVFEHRNKTDPNCFTSKYNVNRLVYAEPTTSVFDAIQREKQLKNWKRKWKLSLVEELNPDWMDLYEDSGSSPE